MYSIHLELTNRCNKNCFMCGRRKIERDYPQLVSEYQDMDFKLVKKISKEVPENILVQFHNNGEPLLYPKLGEALKLFDKQIRCLDTNGKLLVEKRNEIIDNLETLTVSVIENDPEGDEQYETVKRFIAYKGEKRPRLIYRLLGEVTNKDRWNSLPGIVATRVLHSPMGSFEYKKKPTIPEHGICLELLTHLAIKANGDISLCVRFDPTKAGVLGNIRNQTLKEIWNGELRKKYLALHILGMRDRVPLCKNCEYWGVPLGNES